MLEEVHEKYCDPICGNNLILLYFIHEKPYGDRWVSWANLFNVWMFSADVTLTKTAHMPQFSHISSNTSLPISLHQLHQEGELPIACLAPKSPTDRPTNGWGVPFSTGSERVREGDLDGAERGKTAAASFGSLPKRKGLRDCWMAGCLAPG